MKSSSSRALQPGSRWRRFAKLLGFAAVLGGASLGVIIRYVAPEAILHPPRTGIGAAPPSGVVARDFELAGGLKLRSWTARPATTPSAVVFVLHGIADSKASQAGTIQYLANRGIVGIAIDLPAHGESGGDFATYGFREKADLSRLLDLIEPEFPGLPLGLWGTSYGGAVAIQTLASDPRFDFAIIESTFASLPAMARHWVTSHTGLPVGRLADIALSRAGDLAGFDPSAVSPERSMEHITVPVLHLHGGKDELIPMTQALSIGSHARGPSYRFVAIENGTHFHLQPADPTTYSREVESFLDRVATKRD